MSFIGTRCSSRSNNFALGLSGNCHSDIQPFIFVPTVRPRRKYTVPFVTRSFRSASSPFTMTIFTAFENPNLTLFRLHQPAALPKQQAKSNPWKAQQKSTMQNQHKTNNTEYPPNQPMTPINLPLPSTFPLPADPKTIEEKWKTTKLTRRHREITLMRIRSLSYGGLSDVYGGIVWRGITPRRSVVLKTIIVTFDSSVSW